MPEYALNTDPWGNWELLLCFSYLLCSGELNIREYFGEVTDKYPRGRKCPQILTDIRTILKVNVDICNYLSWLSFGMFGRRKYLFAPKKDWFRPCLDLI